MIQKKRIQKKQGRQIRKIIKAGNPEIQGLIKKRLMINKRKMKLRKMEL